MTSRPMPPIENGVSREASLQKVAPNWPTYANFTETFSKRRGRRPQNGVSPEKSSPNGPDMAQQCQLAQDMLDRSAQLPAPSTALAAVYAARSPSRAVASLRAERWAKNTVEPPQMGPRFSKHRGSAAQKCPSPRLPETLPTTRRSKRDVSTEAPLRT